MIEGKQYRRKVSEERKQYAARAIWIKHRDRLGEVYDCLPDTHKHKASCLEQAQVALEADAEVISARIIKVQTIYGAIVELQTSRKIYSYNTLEELYREWEEMP